MLSLGQMLKYFAESVVAPRAMLSFLRFLGNFFPYCPETFWFLLLHVKVIYL